MQQTKPLEEITIDELDAILAEACAKVIAESFAEGVPIIHRDEEKTCREWPDGHSEVIHERMRPETKP
ncbi:hypothetical protein ROLI_027490 [Roseobacter fucihabitans]|uniref:Uncharacterized protein n=1 Tax=Roseobacter fucihabitans TaxID=1537242 RepID=A0ABZ2BUH0_9RHOB|nr:hypothetical protein [Roseobacter litoralis]MBC6966122.1 hypothetical protein [Roseobacter litoralis]